MRLAGKCALMIGAATGIGRACVEDFARNGARLAIADINETALAETLALAKRLGGQASALTCDVRDEGHGRCSDRNCREGNGQARYAGDLRRVDADGARCRP